MVGRNDRIWIEISRSAIRHNLQAVQRVVGRVPIAPVVKANAYGHGILEVAEVLQHQNIWGICVAYGEEALTLRQHGWRRRILVLSFWKRFELPLLVRKNVDVVVWDNVSLTAVMQLPAALRRRARIHIKLDSGTSRIGFLEHQLGGVRQKMRRIGLKPTGIFSHLANSEEAGTARTRKQIIRFTTLKNKLGFPEGLEHIACTAAALRYPEARFGLTRLGIGLFGLWPSSATKRAVQAKYPWFHLKPALTWKSRLYQVKVVAPGTAIGYGSTATVRRSTTIGTIPVGYADGYGRSLSNRSRVVVGGRRVPVIGRVSMNLLTVNLQSVPLAKAGDMATLVGPRVTTDELADLQGTINYEIVARINQNIPRYLV